MKIAGYTLAALGAAYAVKYIKNRKESSRGWHKIKVEEKVKEEKRTGSRYGSNPIRY
jgi:hypothetical protein